MTHKLHVFEKPNHWHGVMPGDAVISPNTYLFKLDDFVCRNSDTKVVIVKHNPLLIIGKIKGPCAEMNVTCDEQSVYIVYSITQGLLAINMYDDECD